MTEQERIATQIFRQYGLSFETAERAGGWTNAVWLNGDFALRVSMRKGNDIIRREVERSKMLPPAVGYPKNIAVGVTDDYEWSLSARIQGKVLNEAWNSFSWAEKTTTVKQIIDIMNGVHSVEVSKIEHLTLKTAWYNSFNKSDSLADIERYVAKKFFTPEQGRVLQDILVQFYNWNDCIAPVLCHGDITMDNLLWHDGNVVSLLDFEHSVIAPPQLDVHSLVNLALTQYDEATATNKILLTEKSEKSEEIKQYVSEMVSLFSQFLFEQSDRDLFMGYNVLYRLRFFEFWLDNPNDEITNCDAYQKLLSFSDGNYGYLSTLMEVTF